MLTSRWWTSMDGSLRDPAAASRCPARSPGRSTRHRHTSAVGAGGTGGEGSRARGALAVVVGERLCLGRPPFAGMAAGEAPPFDAPATVRARRCWLTGTQMALPAGTPRSTLLPARVRDLLATC